MKQTDYVLNNAKEVLAFLKSQYPMYHLSNVFFRDVQYGIRTMFERKGEKISYTDGEKIAMAFVEKLEKERIFNRIDRQSWSLNYPEFKKPTVVQATPAKPAPGAAPAKSPAASTGVARPALPPLGAKPAGAKPALPPLSGAKPADGTKSSLPPLSNAKPVGGTKPVLPPLSSAKPVAPKPTETRAATESAVAETGSVQKSSEPAVGQAKSLPVAPVPSTASAPNQTQAGQKKTLPPLKGNYKPVSK